MDIAIRKKNTQYYITSAIGILIMLFFGKLPAVGVMSPLGMKILGIYIGAIFLWATTDLIWPSLLAVVLIGLTDYSTLGAMLTSGWGNITLIYVWLTFVFVAIIDAGGISGYLAKSICGMKIGKGRPWLITLLFFAASYVVAVLTSVTGGIVICWAIFSKYAKTIGYKKNEPWVVYTMTGMAMAGMMGPCAFTFRSPANIFVGYAMAAGYQVNFLSWAIVAFVFAWVTILLYFVIGKYILKIDASKCAQEYEFEAAGKLTPYQKKLLGVLGLLVLLLLFQSLLPAESAVGKLLNTLGTHGITLCLLIPMAIIRQKETGKPFGDMALGTKNGVQWPVFYLLVLNLPMGAIINNPDLGIAASAKLLLDPIFGGNSGTFLFMILVILLGMAITIFMGNVPAITICWSVTTVYAATMGLNLAMMAAICTMAGSIPVLLPCSNPVAGMLHGQDEWVESKTVMKYAGIGLAPIFVAAVVTFVAFGSWIFA